MGRPARLSHQPEVKSGLGLERTSPVKGNREESPAEIDDGKEREFWRFLADESRYILMRLKMILVL